MESVSYTHLDVYKRQGQCDAVFVTSGLPNATVMDLGVSYDMVIIPIDGEGREKLVNDYPYYAESVIPANTYNNTEDVEGVFVYNIMLVREDLSDEMVSVSYTHLGILYLYQKGPRYKNCALLLALVLVAMEAAVNMAVTSVTTTSRTAYTEDNEAVEKLAGQVQPLSLIHIWR